MKSFGEQVSIKYRFLHNQNELGTNIGNIGGISIKISVKILMEICISADIHKVKYRRSLFN